MSTASEKVCIVIEILEFIIGLCGNGFIGLVICAEWVKNKNISLLDFILMCLAISRIGVICTLLEDSIRRVFYPELFASHLINIIVDFFWNLNNSLSVWCTTSLSVFYFLKLSTFSHPFFLWMKRRRERIVFTILLGFFVSLFVNLLSIKLDTFWIRDYLKIERNLTWQKYVSKTWYFSNQILFNLGSLIPLAVSLISFFLLVFSLWRYVRQMKHHAKESGGLNKEVHVKARNTMISFILLIVVHYLDTLLIICSYYTVESPIIVIIIEMVALLYPSIHPFSMIRGNRKLRQASVNLLRQIINKSCFKAM